MRGLEALLLYRVIGEEANEHLVGSRCDGRGLLGATEATQAGGLPVSAIIDLNVIISTLQVGLHVNLIEGLTPTIECNRIEKLILILGKERKKETYSH